MPADVKLGWGVRIPLRDGVHLSATCYMPRQHCAPAPSILAMTPYVADHHHARAMYFAARGFPFLVVDVRGRGNSAGDFRPNIQEAEDGFDVVEWLARQPYCNGRVAMWGGSYLGYAQWATAKERPPHLTTIVPAAAPYFGVDFPMRRNIFHPFVLQWLLLTGGRTSQLRSFSDSAYWASLYMDYYVSGRSFRELDDIVGHRSPVFQEWLGHPEPDSYWDRFNPTAAQYAGIDIPILTITGSYDDDQSGALEHYRQHMKLAAPEARARHYLIIGPWDHAGTCSELHDVQWQWYEWTMRAGPRPAFLQKRVACYVMGAERWQYADSLEQLTAGSATYFLRSDGYANDVFLSGCLNPRTGSGPPDQYTYDPRDAHGPEVLAESRAQIASLTDQSVMLGLAGRQLIYHTAPFDRDVEICGFFSLRAWIAIDAPDTDIYISVHEICADGSSIRLSTDAIRARYREDLRVPRPVPVGEILEYRFDGFTFIARLIPRGHRLRLVIAPIGRLIDAPFTQRNFNGGGVVAEESIRDARPVTVCLFHDERYLSALTVPLGQ